jgi:hypothetical protein
MDFGNAALNGGFCDPDSIIKIDNSMDDEFICESLIQSLRILQNTVQMILGFTSSSTLYPSIEEFVHRQYIHHLICDAIASERRPGLQLDEQFVKLISPKSLADITACATRKIRVSTYAQYAKRSHAKLDPRVLRVSH